MLHSWFAKTGKEQMRDDPRAKCSRSPSRIERIYVRQQNNGFWLSKFSYSWFTDVMMDEFEGTGGIGLKAGQTAAAAPDTRNQGAGLTVSGLKIDSTNTMPALVVGLWIEDCDAVYVSDSEIVGARDHALKMVAGLWGLHDHFFDNFVCDQTRDSHTAYITGSTGGPAERIQFNDSWFASAGQHAGGSATARGLMIDAISIVNIEINTSRFVPVSRRGSSLRFSARR